MKVSDFAAQVEEFQTKLIEHRQLWGKSLDRIIPEYPIRNVEALQEQSRWLARRLGALRPYITRFDPAWLLMHPATGVTWDALDEAVGLTGVGPVKGPSLRAANQKLDQILGHLATLGQNDEIPADLDKPMRSGATAGSLMIAYLNHLHPFIAKGCAQLYEDAHYAQAVEEAVKAVFQYIRDATGLTTDGAALVQTVFSVKNPVLAFSDLQDDTKRNEQVGFMEMLSAFLKGVRHPLAHTHGRQEEAQKAFEYLVMASLFCRRVDDASPKPVEA
jgi:uncharacterized protein (TIGR02391 family)